MPGSGTSWLAYFFLSTPLVTNSYTTTADRADAKGRYAFVSLGCPKNLVDSERMLGMLQLDGYQMVDDPRGADFAVVNTCGFIEQARQESFCRDRRNARAQTPRRPAGRDRLGLSGRTAEGGLLVDRPEIDHLVGVFGREEVTKVADRLIGGLEEQRSVFQPAPTHPCPTRHGCGSRPSILRF